MIETRCGSSSAAHNGVGGTSVMSVGTLHWSFLKNLPFPRFHSISPQLFRLKQEAMFDSVSTDSMVAHPNSIARQATQTANAPREPD
jgi:hypothetical protein